nr:hypothetical protein [uncultured Undibacterium sp.]
MKQFDKIFQFFLGIFFLGVIAWLGYKLIRAIGDYVSAIPKELGAPIIAAVATVLVATLTVVVGKYYERKKELDALYRDKKTEVYDEFLKKFFEIYFSAGEKNVEEDLVPFLRDFARKLVLWGGPGVIEAFLAWKDHLAKTSPDAKSIFLTEAFILAVRHDLRHTNKGIKRGLFARMFLKNSDLFLAMEAKNPNMKLEDLAELERQIQSS